MPTSCLLNGLHSMRYNRFLVWIESISFSKTTIFFETAIKSNNTNKIYNFFFIFQFIKFKFFILENNFRWLKISCWENYCLQLTSRISLIVNQPLQTASKQFTPTENVNFAIQAVSVSSIQTFHVNVWMCSVMLFVLSLVGVAVTVCGGKFHAGALSLYSHTHIH